MTEQTFTPARPMTVACVLALGGLLPCVSGSLAGRAQPPRQSSALPVEPLLIDVVVDASPAEPWLRFEARLGFRVSEPLAEVRFSRRWDLEVDSVSGDDESLAFSTGEDSLTVHQPVEPADGPVTWTFHYHIDMGRPLGTLDAFYSGSPWYPHLRYPPTDDEIVRYVPMMARLSCTLPVPWALVSSGEPSIDERGGMTDFGWTLPAPVTLIPMIVGRFRRESLRRDGIEVFGFFDPQRSAPATELLRYVADALAFYSETFAPYPSGQYSLVELDLQPEMQGLTVPGMTMMSTAELSTRTPFPYRILAHEVAHVWWSQMLDFPRRADAWLREGLPTYSAMLFLENHVGPEAMRRELLRSRRVALAPEQPEPLERGLDIRDPAKLYALTYHKSAFVLHMLRELMGREKFLGFLRGFHSEQRTGGVTTAASFRRAAARWHGDNLDWFFSTWVEQAEVPSFAVWYRSRPGGRDSWLLTGQITQSNGAIRSPALLRIRLDGGTVVEHRVLLAPGAVSFELSLPARALAVEFDPDKDLLYAGVEVHEGVR